MVELNLDVLDSNVTEKPIVDASHEAAVIVPVIEGPTGHALLFTKRADHLGEHAGQMSFPGGRVESCDSSLLDTALREGREEIGLNPSETRILSVLDEIETVTGYVVSPIVAQIPNRRYTPQEDEVAEITTIPVTDLVDSSNYEVRHRDHPSRGETSVHFFHVDGYTVWGATGLIVVRLLSQTSEFAPPDFSRPM